MLTADQKQQFEAHGYLLVNDVLDTADVLDPIVDEYAGLLDELVDDLFARSEISQTFADLDFRDRMTKVYAETGRTFAQYFNLSLPIVGVTEDTPFWTGPAIFNLIKAPALLDVVESIIGPEIASNPIQHVRIKPPQELLPEDQHASGLVGTTPWHQDAAVIPPDAGTEMITVWVPINDAPVETGCLQFLNGAHTYGLKRHGLGSVDGLALPGEVAEEGKVDVVPAKRGDILLIHRHCPHASLPNTSDRLRFSLDLRFHPADQPSGREIMPSFVARSRRDPSRVLSDAEAWTGMWQTARTWLATSSEAPKSNYEWLR
ncbi:MAG: phytanoyl-CoA dioxygenase family protein [Hyphomicrobiaceae bacterium]